MPGGAKKVMTGQWRNAVKMSNLKKSAIGLSVSVRPEWRHFSPREKAFILNAISNCASSNDLDDVLRDYSAAVIDYMQAQRCTPL